MPPVTTLIGLQEPKPETIRPYPILQRTLQELIDKWKQKTVSYEWICNQLKSVRQDLTVGIYSSLVFLSVIRFV